LAYLLDTNILIAAIKGRPEVVDRLSQLDAAELLLSVVVLGELETGVIKSAWPRRNRERLDQLVAGLELVQVDGATSRAYGQVRADLERQGQPIGANDLWIAAQALVTEAVLVTDNLREFQRVQGLKLENWLLKMTGSAPSSL